MNKLIFLIIAFLLINFLASGQGNSSVEIFQGRGVFKSRKNNALSGCENLQQIYLSGNRNLAILPSLSGINKLEMIDVADTRINDVPGWVRTMDSLYYFKFSKL